MRADLVLHGGDIVTLDPAGTRVSAIAVDGDRILALGHDEAILQLVDAGTTVIDLQGRTVIPGLIDAHTHVELTSYSRHHWNDVRALSRSEIVEYIAVLAAARPAGEWIILQGTFGQDLPSRSELDGAAPDHPVAARWSMHKYQLNSTALSVSGIGRRTIAPSGTRINFGPDGEPNGLIEEGWDLLNWAPPLLEPLQKSISETGKSLFLRHGVTTIHEITASATGIAAYSALARENEVFPRIGLSLTAAPGHQPLISTDTFSRIGLQTGFGNPLVKLSSVKIFVDGGRDGAFRSTDLHNHASEWGVLTRTPQHLAQEVGAGLEMGIQVWIHAIGDLAQEITVSAIEQATRAYPGRDHRTRIEHFGNELYQLERLQRLVNAGGIPAPNPSFIWAEPTDPARRQPSGVDKYGLRTLLDAGARPPGNSDTAGGQPFACNPWFTMKCMVERRNKEGVVINPEQSLTFEEALRAFTADAAYATFQENDRGSLEIGKLADMAILNKDPFKTPSHDLDTVTAQLVLVGGAVYNCESQTPTTEDNDVTG
jgi:predicted amidohydrolase YtcJ